jgi:sugar-phosphatase
MSRAAETIVCSAILFDMDGVLVDSRATVRRTWQRWAKLHGLDPEMMIRAAQGRRMSETLRDVAPHLDIAREVAWLDEAERTDEEPSPAVPGAAHLLDSLPSWAWAVVTSAGRRLAMRRLREARLQVPENLISSEDVVRGKPAPDGYLLAASDLGEAPSDCVVLEDSPAGVEAGHSSGARVIGVTTMLDAAYLPGATLTVPDLSYITAIVDDERITLKTRESERHGQS